MRRLCWRWDGARRASAPGLFGERPPRPLSRTLFDRSWCVVGGTASDPGVPRCGARTASSTGRSRRGKPAKPLAARCFFYLGPSGLDPTLDGGLVALDGPTLRFLRAPAQAAPVHSDFPSNLGRLEPVVKKRDGAQAPLFKEPCASG